MDCIVTTTLLEIVVTVLKDNADITAALKQALREYSFMRTIIVKSEYNWYITDFFTITYLILDGNVTSFNKDMWHINENLIVRVNNGIVIIPDRNNNIRVEITGKIEKFINLGNDSHGVALSSDSNIIMSDCALPKQLYIMCPSLELRNISNTKSLSIRDTKSVILNNIDTNTLILNDCDSVKVSGLNRLNKLLVDGSVLEYTKDAFPNLKMCSFIDYTFPLNNPIFCDYLNSLVALDLANCKIDIDLLLYHNITIDILFLRDSTNRDLIMTLKPVRLYIGYQEEKGLLLQWLSLENRKSLIVDPTILGDEYLRYHNVLFFDIDGCMPLDSKHNRNAGLKQITLEEILVV